MATTISSSRLAAIVAKMKADKEKAATQTPVGFSPEFPPNYVHSTINEPESKTSTTNLLTNPKEDYSQILDKYGKPIELNAKQMEFVNIASTGQSCVLLGAAGTGKTTCQKAVTLSLIQSGLVGILQANGHKHLVSGTPGIVICAYTRRAVNNIRKNVPPDLESNCITIHKLLEYQPTYNEVLDENSGEYKTKMSFEPGRHHGNPLPSTIKTIIIEEGSMLGLDLWEKLVDACMHEVQFIFLGDIQQLPPVFGPAILGFKMLELPVVELTTVYRQALESPIISLAHRILSGNPIPSEELKSLNVPGKLKITRWSKKIDATNACNTMIDFFKRAYDGNAYDPEEDIILIPFNKSFGTDEVNKGIANHLAKSMGRITYEVIAGFNKLYFSVGDKVMYDKEDAIITNIEINPTYTGAQPQKESTYLDYWGYNSNMMNEPTDDEVEMTDEQVDFLLAQVSANSEDRVRVASHIITIQMTGTDAEIKLDKASELNNISLGYAMTVHKSQGSEWKRVFFLTHQSHATMMQRELLYTGVTRAREELIIVCEPDGLTKAILSQKVKGNTLQEKAEYFKGKAKERGIV